MAASRFANIISRFGKEDFHVFVGKRAICVGILLYIQDPIEISSSRQHKASFFSFTNPIEGMREKLNHWLADAPEPTSRTDDLPPMPSKVIVQDEISLDSDVDLDEA
eukprot:gb/GEZN01015360.1/.p1 GENE.gb/GEZN01015360.1/~~gb/GEZN01015360.1/.p1  ORF type:complete len:107 (+),score=14.87 gb/GEZN01015360.1/:68-388(+)